MGFFASLFYPWGLLLQAAAIIHFIRRRPDTYWIFIILFLGPPWRAHLYLRRGPTRFWTSAAILQNFPAAQAHLPTALRDSRQSVPWELGGAGRSLYG